MALPSSGSLKMSQIAGEFGGSTPHKLSEYYGKAAGIPGSGTIKISHFRGKSSIVYKTLAGGSNINLRSWLNSVGVHSGRVQVTITKDIKATSTGVYALNTGDLSPFSRVDLVIQAAVYIYGKGGNGGGRESNGHAGGGAFYAHPSCSGRLYMTNHGTIGGGGGGGGAGSGYYTSIREDKD